VKKQLVKELRGRDMTGLLIEKKANPLAHDQAALVTACSWGHRNVRAGCGGWRILRGVIWILDLEKRM